MLDWIFISISIFFVVGSIFWFFYLSCRDNKRNFSELENNVGIDENTEKMKPNKKREILDLISDDEIKSEFIIKYISVMVDSLSMSEIENAVTILQGWKNSDIKTDCVKLLDDYSYKIFKRKLNKMYKDYYRNYKRLLHRERAVNKIIKNYYGDISEMDLSDIQNLYPTISEVILNDYVKKHIVETNSFNENVDDLFERKVSSLCLLELQYCKKK